MNESDVFSGTEKFMSFIIYTGRVRDKAERAHFFLHTILYQVSHEGHFYMCLIFFP